jgi:hypothetical protein
MAGGSNGSQRAAHGDAGPVEQPAPADVCFEAHHGLKSDVVPSPKSANERTRFAGARCARSGASGTDGVTR